MNEFAKKWVEALRSGEYSQCRGVLYNGDGYCCLGVAMEVLYGPPQKINCTEGIPFGWPDDKGEIPHTVELSEEAAEILGLRSVAGKFSDKALPFDYKDEEYGVHTQYLTELNDSVGLSFNAIADFIEANEDKLFGVMEKEDF